MSLKRASCAKFVINAEAVICKNCGCAYNLVCCKEEYYISPTDSVCCLNKGRVVPHTTLTMITRGESLETTDLMQLSPNLPTFPAISVQSSELQTKNAQLAGTTVAENFHQTVFVSLPFMTSKLESKLEDKVAKLDKLDKIDELVTNCEDHESCIGKLEARQAQSEAEIILLAAPSPSRAM